MEAIKANDLNEIKRIMNDRRYSSINVLTAGRLFPITLTKNMDIIKYLLPFYRNSTHFVDSKTLKHLYRHSDNEHTKKVISLICYSGTNKLLPINIIAKNVRIYYWLHHLGYDIRAIQDVSLNRCTHHLKVLHNLGYQIDYSNIRITSDMIPEEKLEFFRAKCDYLSDIDFKDLFRDYPKNEAHVETFRRLFERGVYPTIDFYMTYKKQYQLTYDINDAYTLTEISRAAIEYNDLTLFDIMRSSIRKSVWVYCDIRSSELLMSLYDIIVQHS